MLLVSWNVAGLKPALQRIHSDYGASNNGTADATLRHKSSMNVYANKAIDPFVNYLLLHGDIDILCIQEHKIPLSQLSDSAEPYRCSSLHGFESFWSCATDPKSRGFNGVVTFVKKGFVQAADSAPFKDPELDNQGRCVMTDHGSFVILNVYVPCGNGPGKMKFLNALLDVMNTQRIRGKHVILMGDMNLKADKKDVHWSERMLNVNQIIYAVKEDTANTLPLWKRQIADKWSNIELALETIEAVPRKTSNPTTKETFEKFRARVATSSDDKFIWLGSFEDTPEQAISEYKLDEQSYIDPASNAVVMCRRRNVLSLRTLIELMTKIGGVQWDDDVRIDISNSEDAQLNTDSPSYLWMKALLEGDNAMIDVFRFLYPSAEDRRYANEGSRIDYILVDKALMSFVELNNSLSLRCGTDSHIDPLGKEAALLAATANGQFEPTSFAGGGITVATKRALDSQFGHPHTGMIYTPPGYSDHIAVSLLMKDSFKESIGSLELLSDASTRNAQPSKKQRSISSFFSSSKRASSSNCSSNSTTSSQEKRKPLSAVLPSSSKKVTVTSFFQPKQK